MKVIPELVQMKGGPGFRFMVNRFEYNIFFRGNPILLLEVAYLKYGGVQDFQEVYKNAKLKRWKDISKADKEALRMANEFVSMIFEVFDYASEIEKDLFVVYYHRLRDDQGIATSAAV